MKKRRGQTMSFKEKLRLDAQPVAAERIGQPKLKKKIRIAFEAVKRFLIIVFIFLTILTAAGQFDSTIAAAELIQNEEARQILVGATGISDIEIVGAHFHRIYYDESSGDGLYGVYVTPSSESMAVYADAEPGSDEATELLFKMRRLCLVVNNQEKIADLVEPWDHVYPTAPKGRKVTLIAGDHKYYYQQTYLKEGEPGCEPELLKIDDKVIYSRMSKG